MSFEPVFVPRSIPGAPFVIVLAVLLLHRRLRSGLNLCVAPGRGMRLAMAVSLRAAQRLAAGMRAVCLRALCAMLLVAAPVAAQARSVQLLRDADIEHSLSELARPVLVAAGLNPTRVRILVVDSSSLNAFVIDQRAIFVNYGLILKCETPEMLQAVLAHEAAHIVNGHIGRRTQNMRSASSAAGFGMALALLAAAGGAGEAAAGVAFGVQTSALRNLLSHTRAEEASADRSALGFLTRAGINPRGMIDVHRIFAGQEVLSAAHQDPYMRSHPLSRDRVRAAEAYVTSLGDIPPPRQSDAYWLARAKGKLSAFTRAPNWSLRRAGSDPYEDLQKMRRAVAYHRQSNLSRAQENINALLAAHPEDAYYHELRGQILSENRQWDAALSAYRRAAQLAPKEPLILAGLGRAQLSAGHPREALKTLERARAIDFRNAKLLRDMSLAYAQTKQPGMAAMVTAERYALQGRLSDAGTHAIRATQLLPEGSPAWRRAHDVLIAYEQDQKKRKKKK